MMLPFDTIERQKEATADTGARGSRVRRALRTLGVGVALGAVGCGAGADSADHPYITPIAGSFWLPDTVTVLPSGAPRGAAAIVEFRRRLEAASLVTTVGSADSPSFAVFGRITDLAVDSAGDLYVLDALASEIRQFGPDGTFRRRFGGKGDGPTELRDPVAVAFTSSGALAVASRANIKVLDIADSAVTLKRTLLAGNIPSPRDLCVIGHDMVVRSWTSEDAHIAHVMSPDGIRRRSFAKGYEHGGPIVRRQVSAGPIACTDDPVRVVVGYHNLPLIQGFDTAGTLHWETHLPDFTPERVIETVNAAGAPEVATDATRPFDRLLSLASGPGGIIVAQVARLAAADPTTGHQAVERIRTFALSAEDGSGIRLADGFGLVLAATPTHLLAIDEHPTEFYGRILIYQTDAAR